MEILFKRKIFVNFSDIVVFTSTKCFAVRFVLNEIIKTKVFISLIITLLAVESEIFFKSRFKRKFEMKLNGNIKKNLI